MLKYAVLIQVDVMVKWGNLRCLLRVGERGLRDFKEGMLNVVGTCIFYKQ